MTMTLRVMMLLSTGLFTACAHGAGLRAGGDAPRDPTAAEFVQIAEGAERMGDSLRAQQYLNAALRAGAEETEVTPRLLRLYVADGQYRVAIEQCEHYLRRQPDDRTESQHREGPSDIHARQYDTGHMITVTRSGPPPGCRRRGRRPCVRPGSTR